MLKTNSAAFGLVLGGSSLVGSMVQGKCSEYGRVGSPYRYREREEEGKYSARELASCQPVPF